MKTNSTIVRYFLVTLKCIVSVVTWCRTVLVYRVILAVFFSNRQKYFTFLRWFIFKIIYSFKSQAVFKTFQWLPLSYFYVESLVQKSFGVNLVTQALRFAKVFHICIWWPRSLECWLTEKNRWLFLQSMVMKVGATVNCKASFFYSFRIVDSRHNSYSRS